MSQSIIGSASFTEQPKRRQKVKGRGWVTLRTWYGPRSAIDAFVLSDVAPLEPEDIDVSEGTPAVITATFPDDINNAFSSDPLIEAEDEAIWELIPMVLDKSLATHPAFQASGAVPTVIELIEKAIREGTSTESDWDTDYGIPYMNDYRNLRVKGVDSYRTWGYTIRKTISIGDQVQLQAEEANTQSVVQYSAIGIPARVKWAQPKLVLWDGNNTTEAPIAEWLASPPQIRYTRKKYEIVREWIGAVKWYGILYKGGTALTTESGIN